MVSLNDIFTPANGLVAGLLRSPVGKLAGRALLVLEYDGRVSGRRISFPVGYQRDADTVAVLISKPHEKSWWKNFREPWPADLTVCRERLSAVGTVVPPSDPAFLDHIEGTLQRMPWLGSQFGGVKYKKKSGLTPDQRETLKNHTAVVTFALG